MVKAESIHLGDGAYITKLQDGDYMILANHHDPTHATDRVQIKPRAMQLLIDFVNAVVRGEEVEL